jgi:hypothetical protein
LLSFSAALWDGKGHGKCESIVNKQIHPHTARAHAYINASGHIALSFIRECFMVLFSHLHLCPYLDYVCVCVYMIDTQRLLVGGE